MPLYEYECHTCGKIFEINAKMADAPPTRGQDCISSKCVLEKCVSLTAPASRAGKGADLIPVATDFSALAPSAGKKKGHVCGGGCSH